MKSVYVKSLFLSLCLILIISQLYSQNDAVLNVESTNQGVLVPRISLTGKDDVTTIPSATISLLVYNTNTTSDIAPGYYYWDGSSWVGIVQKRHYVGEIWGGGIVFFVYDDGRHGLIASLFDLDNGNGASWGLYDINVSNCESMTDGATNTAAIIAAGGLGDDAAGLCDTFSAGGYTDWYLPSNRELYLLAKRDLLIDQILDNDGDPLTNGLSQEFESPTYGRYWSSTERLGNNAWYYYFTFGHSDMNLKFDPYSVRAIRAF
jgi:hypothetical protein